MNNTEWQQGIDAWEKVKKQASIDVEQADLYIEAIKNKMKSLEESKEEVK